MSAKKSWPKWERPRPTAELANELATHIENGLMLKQACQLVGVRMSTVREWLEQGEDQLARLEDSETGHPGDFGMFALVVDRAVGKRAKMLVDQLRSAGAGKDSSPGSAGWLLERLERDFNLASRIEVSGPDAGPLQIEGRPIVSIRDIVSLARELGATHLLGLEPARDALPPAREVLPDPAELESTASAVPR